MKISKTSILATYEPPKVTFSAQTPGTWKWLRRPPRKVVTQIAKGVQWGFGPSFRRLASISSTCAGSLAAATKPKKGGDG